MSIKELANILDEIGVKYVYGFFINPDEDNEQVLSLFINTNEIFEKWLDEYEGGAYRKYENQDVFTSDDEYFYSEEKLRENNYKLIKFTNSATKLLQL